MENIFEGAKFGDMFKTRDGRDAVLITYNQRNLSHPYVLAVQCYQDRLKSVCHNFHPDGRLLENLNCDDDIVSRKKEELDETKLDEIVDDLLDDAYLEAEDESKRRAAEWGCKLGYIKAKEE